MLKYPAIIIISLTLLSCERTELITDIDVYYSPKLVVYAALTPRDSIFVHVTKSQYILSEAQKVNDVFVLDATVKISNELGEVITLHKIKDELPVYATGQEMMPVESGKVYSIEISAEGFETVKASTLVPERAIKWISTKQNATLIPYDYYNVPGIEVQGYWQEDSLSEVSCKVLVKTTKRYTDGTIPEYRHYSALQDYTNISVLGSKNMYHNYFETVQYNDVYVNCDFPLHNCTVDSGTVISTLEQLELYLITTDTHLKKFSEADNIYSDLWFSHDSFLDKFRGIIPEYSNIENGLGVFGSYVTAKEILKPNK